MMLYEFTFKSLSPFTSKIESYTIFGALCWGYKNFFGEKELLILLERFNSDPPFLISSCILKHNGKKYFPCPQIKDDFLEPKDEEEYKEQKEIKKRLNYIREDIFIEFLEGKIKSKKELGDRIKEFEKSEQYNTPEIKHILMLHNAINRLTWTTVGGTLYNVSSYFYPEFSIFICLLNETFPLDKLKVVFNIISFGGNKSIGYGRVKLVNVERVKKFEKYLNPSSTGPIQKFYTLSPTFPDSSFDYDNSYYQLSTFCGKVENFYERLTVPILKRRVLYLQPGSVLTIKDNYQKKFYGGLIEVLSSSSLTNSSKKIKIYQYGYAFPFYIKTHGG